MPGHWEGDLILGKYKRSVLGTLVERTTRYTLLVPLEDKKDALSVREAFAKAFCSIPTELKKSLTYDQGKEMSEHQRFTIDTDIRYTLLIQALPEREVPTRNCQVGCFLTTP